ncbi:MAG: SusD/RagB family nutrient-binding outer membrane lipoprotein [Cytophagales bacterium]|nr:MAG: SusD/RagB family nutrient-binding outer membrane lipoprotein [Cytophagales bacterium]
MKKINIFLKTLLALVVLMTTGCELTNLDINKNPNSPLAVPPGLLLTNAVRTATYTTSGLSDSGLGFTGVTASSDRFDLNFGSYTGTWSNYYSGSLKDIEEILIATDPAKVNNPVYRGIAQVLKAYYFSVIVDFFGEAPYTEAFKGNDASFITNPKYDDGKAIYDDLFKLLDEASANLQKTSPITITGDPIYNGNAASWLRAANSLRLRLLIQTRRVDSGAAAKIAAAVNAPGGLITTPAQDLSFQFSRLLNPDNRHPWYQSAYGSASNAFTYIIHQYTLEMLENEDPRVPFYFKRQSTRILDFNNSTDRNTASTGYPPFNPIWIDRLYTKKGLTYNPTVDGRYLAGFSGRERGDPAGIPADTDIRLAPGVYPAGGEFDTDAGVRITGGNNKGVGAGLFPMITSVNVKFYQIEAMLTAGLAGDPRALFATTIREHISRVASFSATLDARAVAPTAAAVDKYVNLFLAKYDAAPTNEGKLSVVLKQAWFSNWGNGIEIYNAFRRTGYPGDVIPPLSRQRQFALRIPYSTDDLNLNSNAPKDRPAFDAVPVFWDVLKFKF